VNLVDDGVYSARYRFLSDGDTGKDLSRVEHEFLNQLRAVNQRKNVLQRLILFLFRYQYKYLLTGNQLDLYPLSQASAAKAIFEEEATVSRIIRDKTIVTPGGVVPIKFFFHRVSKTVENLVLIRERDEIERGVRSRPFTDVEIRDILKSVYHVDLSRRSITYHRNRCLKKSNFYSRVRKARDSKVDRRLESGVRSE
jgi:RNA polymerase sigma-54 factor